MELVAEGRLETPQENTDRKMRTAFERMFLKNLRKGWAVWWEATLRLRRAQKEREAADVILRAAHGYLGRAKFNLARRA